MHARIRNAVSIKAHCTLLSAFWHLHAKDQHFKVDSVEMHRNQHIMHNLLALCARLLQQWYPLLTI